MGPILYAIYTNEFPETTKEDDCEDSSHDYNEEIFGKNCEECGIMTCYADDSTVVITSSRRGDLKEKLTRKLNDAAEFLQRNKLTINQKKSKIQEHMVRQKRVRLRTDPPELNVQTPEGMKTIKSNVSERLLGINLQNDTSWKSHLQTGEKPLMSALRKRLGALKHLGTQVPKNGRKLLATGLIISKLIYMIPVWGGAPITYIRKLQRIVNNSARYILNGARRWKTDRLMEEVNWLRVDEMMEFHSLLTLWKILRKQTPKYLAQKFIIGDDWRISTSSPRLQITASAFRWRSREMWNRLPDDIRLLENISGFKKQLRTWIVGRRSQNMEDQMGNNQMVINHIPQLGGQDMGQNMGQNMGQVQVGQNMVQDMGQNMGQNMGQAQRGQNMVQNMGQNMGQAQVGQNMVQDMGQNMVQNMGRNMGQNMGQNMVQDMGQNRVQNMRHGNRGQNMGQGHGNRGQNMGPGHGQNTIQNGMQH